MATVELTRDNIEKTVEENDLVLIDFWASWCGPCKNFAPVYEAASEAHPDAVFGKVDTEAEQELAAAFGIRAIPTLVIFREQVPLLKQPGALPAEALDEILAQARALDMDEVRAEIAQAEAEGAKSSEG